MSLLETEGEMALLRGSLYNKRTATDFIESLGLISVNNGHAKPKFSDTNVADLYRWTGTAADSLIEYHGKTAAELHTHLYKEETLSKHLHEFATKYGTNIWGRSDRSHLLTPGSKRLYPRSLFWNSAQDQKVIKFYVRCWIIKQASRRFENRKTKDVQRNHDTSTTEKLKAGKNVVDISDTESSDGEPISITSPKKRTTPTTMRGMVLEGLFRAPPARMYPTPQPRTDTRQGNKSPQPSVEATISVRTDVDNESDHDSLYADPPKPTSPQVPNKRKTADSLNDTSRRKLPKINAWRRTIPELAVQNQNQENPYSAPHSPVFESVRIAPAFGRRNNRVDAEDSDPSYRPSRSASVVTEAEDINQVMGESVVVDKIFQTEQATEAPFVLERRGFPTSPPPSPRRDSVIRDSVIPGDIQDDFPRVSINLTADKTISGVTNESLPLYIPWEEKELRRELFKLLLSRLNNLNQFTSKKGGRAAEERLNHLLLQFWLKDMDTLQKKFGDSFVRLHVALESWIEMRDQMHSFQDSVEYYGNPGIEWRTHLREIADAGKRAEACLALAGLHDMLKDGEKYIETSFNEDLCTVFNQLTKFPGCNGAEEFGSIKAYNEKVIAWLT